MIGPSSHQKIPSAPEQDFLKGISGFVITEALESRDLLKKPKKKSIS